jgi:hypothetical protein
MHSLAYQAAKSRLPCRLDNISAANGSAFITTGTKQPTFIRLHALVHPRREQLFVDESLIVLAHDLGVECHSVLDEPLILRDQERQVCRYDGKHDWHEEVMVWVE